MLKYLDFLEQVAKEDVRVLLEKEESYKGSCFKRGGIGFYMMLCRKWDRLEAAVESHNWDIFAAVNKDLREEGILDDIRDLRRYLMLGEAYLIAQMEKEKQELATSKIAYQTTATPAGMRKVPRHDPSPTGMESPFGYDPELDDK